MPDVFTKQKRSEVMSRIRGRGDKDKEMALASGARLWYFGSCATQDSPIGR
jgi:G:T-mismatch repair DNA endonuclease (very short patch repair protein)